MSTEFSLHICSLQDWWWIERPCMDPWATTIWIPGDNEQAGRLALLSPRLQVHCTFHPPETGTLASDDVDGVLLASSAGGVGAAVQFSTLNADVELPLAAAGWLPAPLYESWWSMSPPLEMVKPTAGCWCCGASVFISITGLFAPW